MVKRYWLDLRGRAVRRVVADHTVREVAENFGAGVSSVVKRSQRKRQTGSAAAKPMGSRIARSLAARCERMLAWLVEKPDMTLREPVAELKACAVEMSYGSVWRLLKNERIGFKKACAPRSRSGLTSPAAAPVGRPIGRVPVRAGGGNSAAVTV